MTKTVTIRMYSDAIVKLANKFHISASRLDKKMTWQKYFQNIPEDAPDKLEQIIKATYSTLQSINQHSYYHRDPTTDQKGNPYVAPVPEGRIEDGDIAYLWLPQCVRLEDHQSYSKTGFEISTRLKAQNLAGAIIDLRNNHGGGCDPMLAAISPFLDKENFIGLAYKRQEFLAGITWDHHLGLGRVGTYTRPFFDSLPSTPNTTLPVAVIYGNETCSAGEAVALALRGSPLSRSFGHSTCGNTTSNDGFPVPYGKILGAKKSDAIVLSTSCMTDRNHNVFNDVSIKPDEESKSNDPMQDAIEWIRAFER